MILMHDVEKVVETVDYLIVITVILLMIILNLILDYIE